MTKGSNQPKIKPEMNDATFLGHTFSPSNARPEVSDKVLTAIERRKNSLFQCIDWPPDVALCQMNYFVCFLNPAIGDTTRD